MLDLDAIEAAEKKMTPGPLAQKHCRVSDRFDNTLAYTNHRADAEGIVLLRNSAREMVARIRSQAEEIKRLRRFVTDQGTTCYSCESCGHARTTRECLRCEVKELRALCGEADEFIEPDYGGTLSAPRNAIKARLRAASKGEL